MQLITYKRFGKLRLRDYLDKNEIDSLWNCEFMGKVWLGEAYFFTTFLKPYWSPFKTKAISLDLHKLPTKTSSEILNHLGLPLKRGMTFEKSSSFLGKPLLTYDKLADRITYEFIIGKKEKYYISCTFKNDEGLIGLDMTNDKKTITKLYNGTLYD